MSLPEALPELEIDPEELKRRLGSRATVQNDEKEGETLEAEELFGPALLDAANTLNIDLDACTPQQIADLRSLALWWVGKYPHHTLTLELFPRAWQDSSAGAKRKGAARRKSPCSGTDV